MTVRWKNRVTIGIASLVGLFVALVVIFKSEYVLGRVFRSVQLSQVSVGGSHIERARQVAMHEGLKSDDLGELIWSNYFSPQVLSELIAPGRGSTLRWEWPDTNKRPQLLDANGYAVSLAMADEPMRLGSLVVYPRSETIGSPEWSMVILPGARLDQFVVTLTDAQARAIEASEFDAEFAKENSARAARAAPPIADPRLVPDRLHPNELLPSSAPSATPQ